MSNFIPQRPVPCQHIADFYAHKQAEQPCLGYNLLRKGYAQWAMGKIEGYHNNLYYAIITLNRV